MRRFFVFDVESVGLHGEGFAVGGGVFLENGANQWGFSLACPIAECKGDDNGRDWVKEHVPVLGETHRSPKTMRFSFWFMWLKAKNEGAIMAADCGWPVEARFLAQCVDDDATRFWEGPYPMVEISSVLMCAGMDPMTKYPRQPSELPEHNPYADAVQSARLLAEALGKLKAKV